MHSPAGQGANRSDTGWYREDLQRSHVGEGAISQVNHLSNSTLDCWSSLPMVWCGTVVQLFSNPQRVSTKQ